MQRATSAMQARQFAEAVRCFDAALAIDAGLWPARLGKASSLAEAGQFRPARELALGLTGKDLGTARLHAELGLLLSRMRCFGAAIGAYESARILDPDNPDIHYSLATLNRYVGELKRAEEHVNQCIALNPRDCEAQLFRSQLATATPRASHVDELKLLLGGDLPEFPHKSQLLYALAKEHEDLGQYDRSFECVDRGARIRRRHIRYSIADDERAIQKVIDTFSEARIGGEVDGHPTQAPIFIVGLPRSGTTLVDRILSSHADITSIGEVNSFAQALIGLVNRQGGSAISSKLDFIEASAHVDWRQLGEDYLRSVEVIDVTTSRFIDKLPLNFLYVGLIKLALPNATIIHVRRHPVAVCYSMYRQWFKDAYPFSYDLSELARYHDAYARLMRHWQAATPGSMIEVAYETVVSDPRGVCSRLLEACGVPWDERCMEYATNDAPVMTASAVQVRRPLYWSSIDSWKRVEKQLSGLRSLLASEDLH